MSFYIVRWVLSYIVPSATGWVAWEASHNGFVTFVVVAVTFVIVMSMKPSRR